MRAKAFWLVFLLLSFVVTLPVSWYAMAKADFFYPTLHDTIGIDKHIQRFAPFNNKNKREFEKTTKAERVALFHGVVEAIHNQGEGLTSLAYTQQSTQQSIPLFTQAEVQHLKDVAELLQKLLPVIAVLASAWLFAVILMLVRRIPLPSTRQFLSLAAVLLVTLVLVLLLGPERIFNQLHIWAFPEENQWFFYYEESLMSTMMMAPNLFAYIAAIWLLFSVILTALLLMLLRKLQARICKPA